MRTSYDLSSWERGALKLLGEHEGRYAFSYGPGRTGSQGLAKKGLAVEVGGHLRGCFELTDAGRGEYNRRRQRGRVA